jgi:hypothetical protein
MKGIDSTRWGFFEVVLIQICMDRLHMIERHGHRMGPRSSVGTVFVFQRLHQVQDDGSIGRVAGNRVSCDIDPPVAAIPALPAPGMVVLSG